MDKKSIKDKSLTLRINSEELHQLNIAVAVLGISKTKLAEEFIRYTIQKSKNNGGQQ